MLDFKSYIYRNDKFSLESKNRELGELAQANETSRIIEEANNEAKYYNRINRLQRDFPEQFAKGGSINIDPSKKGTFKAQATKMGMSVQQAADTILNAPEGKYSPEMRKKANFAKNFAKKNGGRLKYQGGGFAGTVLARWEDRAVRRGGSGQDGDHHGADQQRGQAARRVLGVWRRWGEDP